MKYLLDADTISFYTRENHNVIQALQKHQAKNCCVSSVTRMEIEFGLQLVSDRRNKLDFKLEPFFKETTPIEYSLEDARFTAIAKAQLQRLGTPIGFYDIMLAGTALARDLILITHNTREFSRVTGLRFNDWSISE
jgi:tRNA(fMet)-specific endonuclease VapC